MPKKLLDSEKAVSRYNNDCSPIGLATNFMTIRRDASVNKPISTGSAVGDFALTTIPGIGKAVKLINTPPQIGAHIAHGINTYQESCGNRKKK